MSKSARERIGRQTVSQKVPSKKGSLGVIFSPRNCRENAHAKSANSEGRHSGPLARPAPFVYFREIIAESAGQVYLIENRWRSEFFTYMYVH